MGLLVSRSWVSAAREEGEDGVEGGVLRFLHELGVPKGSLVFVRSGNAS